ncbi:hemolysin family protein [Tomitella gaofuii]|uniref:hemolysin family protein n=1 Tax=Tomitella gaofuii TaxID=2760083 RepID=UPI0015FE2239|nr:hemolysin family protein [Tomitella gaofuii]
MNIAITILSLVGFFALTLGTAVFVAAEFSLTALEKSTVDSHARDGDRRARIVQHAHRTLSFQLSGAQLGITITTLLTGFIAEPVFSSLFHGPLVSAGLSDSTADWIALALALIIATSLSMILGELVPKNLAIAHPLSVARATAPLQAGFSLAGKWALNTLNGTANAIVRRLGIEPADELRSARSPDELGSLVRNSAKQGSLAPGTALLVDRSLNFGERTADELMTPRVRIESLDRTDTVTDLVELAARTGYSRFPVTDGDLDATIGVVHIKQAFGMTAESRASRSVGDIARTVPSVPASLDGDAVMERVRAHGMQVALVVDEYGGTAGMISMEDLVEEILGDVRDEHDATLADVQPTADGWLCSGLLRIDEVSAAIGLPLPEGDYETLAGLLLTEFGHIPAEGEEITVPIATTLDDEQPTLGDQLGAHHEVWRARVVRMDGRRIDRVALSTELPADESDGTVDAGGPAGTGDGAARGGRGDR